MVSDMIEQKKKNVQRLFPVLTHKEWIIKPIQHFSQRYDAKVIKDVFWPATVGKAHMNTVLGGPILHFLKYLHVLLTVDHSAISVAIPGIMSLFSTLPEINKYFSLL